MIDFKNRTDIVPSAIIVCSVFILLGTLLYMVLVPAPSAAGVAKGRARSSQEVRSQTAQARQQREQAQADVDTRLWKGDSDTVVALILARLTKNAAQNGLQVAAFRPQKQQLISGMTELPFTMQVAGPYPTVLAFLRSVDTPTNKLALRSLQIASSDGASNTVTMTVGMSAYYADDSPKPAASATPAASVAPVEVKPAEVRPAAVKPAAVAVPGGTHGKG